MKLEINYPNHNQYEKKKIEFLYKMAARILDIRNSLSIAFLVISDRYATLFFWNFFSIAVLAILDPYEIFIFLEIFNKMAAVGYFGCQKFTFDRISGHFR